MNTWPKKTPKPKKKPPKGKKRTSAESSKDIIHEAAKVYAGALKRLADR